MLLARYKSSLVNLVYESEDEKENLFKQQQKLDQQKIKRVSGYSLPAYYFNIF